MTTEQMDWLDDHDPEWQAKLRKERNYPRRKRVSPDPLARNKAVTAHLVLAKLNAELNHFRRTDGTCAFVPPCSACGVITEADKALAILDQEAGRV